MKGNARDFTADVVYDEAEVRRRLARVYRLLLAAARQKRLRDERSAAAQGVSADTEGFV